MGPYEWHYTDEDDRPWLQEAMTNFNFSNPNTAISMNESIDFNLDICKFSVIGSENRNNIVWIAHSINRSKNLLSITAIAIHPTYRDQDYIRIMGTEYLNYVKINNPWNVEYLRIITGASFSAGRDLFGGPWSEVLSEDMKTSTIALSEM